MCWAEFLPKLTSEEGELGRKEKDLQRQQIAMMVMLIMMMMAIGDNLRANPSSSEKCEIEKAGWLSERKGSDGSLSDLNNVLDVDVVV